MSPMEIFMAMQESESKEEAIAILRTEREGWLVRVLTPTERENAKCHFCGLESKPPRHIVKYLVNTFDPVLDAHKRSQVCCCNTCLIRFGRQAESITHG